MRGCARDATITAVTASTSDGAILGASASNARQGASIYYDGAATLYLLIGSGTASSANHSLKMGDGFLTYFELPANYNGAVRGIWSAAVGAALVTEYV